MQYLFNTLSSTTDSYLETLIPGDIESFRYLHFKKFENRLAKKIVYTDFNTYRRLTTEQKQFTILIKENEKTIRISLVNRNRFFVLELMHEKSKTNMLSKPKFIEKVLSNTITGRQRFSLKYLYKCKLKHITVTLTKDEFILLNFRKRNESLIFDFFSFKTDDPLVPKKKKRNN